MNKMIVFMMVLVMVLLLGACAAGPNALEGTPTLSGEPAGFLLGVWHGFISMFTFIVSLFSDQVGVYEVYNNGNWYDFGFILGILIFYGGGGSGSSRSRK